MTFGIGNLVALICIVISIIFAIRDAPSHQRALVGFARHLRGLVVGCTRAMGPAVRVSLVLLAIH